MELAAFVKLCGEGRPLVNGLERKDLTPYAFRWILPSLRYHANLLLFDVPFLLLRDRNDEEDLIAANEYMKHDGTIAWT